MPRTALGTGPQPETKAALFAYFAARLSGIPVTRFDEFFRGLSIRVGSAGAMRAIRPLRYQSPLKARAGRKPSGIGPSTLSPTPAVRDWLLVDEAAVGVEIALAHFPGVGRAQAELVRSLKEISGVRQILETAHKRDVYAVVLFRGPVERRNLRARLEEIASTIVWDDVLWETHDPAVATWCDLARKAAAEEGLAD